MSGEEERWILGAILDGRLEFDTGLSDLDFDNEAHRRIYRRMRDLYERGETIDRATVANELMKHGQLGNSGGLSYLVELTD